MNEITHLNERLFVVREELAKGRIKIADRLLSEIVNGNHIDLETIKLYRANADRLYIPIYKEGKY